MGCRALARPHKRGRIPQSVWTRVVEFARRGVFATSGSGAYLLLYVKAAAGSVRDLMLRRSLLRDRAGRAFAGFGTDVRAKGIAHRRRARFAPKAADAAALDSAHAPRTISASPVRDVDFPLTTAFAASCARLTNPLFHRAKPLRTLAATPPVK